jgi:hypothetical protein
VTIPTIFTRFAFAFAVTAGWWLWGGELQTPAASQSAAAMRQRVTRPEVWRAVLQELRERGFSEEQLPHAGDLDLPVALPALAGRKVRVSSACWDEGAQREQFRLECGEPGECLPFLVFLARSKRDQDTMDARSLAVSCSPASFHRVPQTQPKSAVRVGDRGTAMFVADRLRMMMRVTCLERGREGEVIRVRSLDGHIFRAQISRITDQGIALAVQEARRP